MPPGVPVATVSINGGKNAALLAAQILGIEDESLSEKLSALKEQEKEKIVEKNRLMSKKIK